MTAYVENASAPPHLIDRHDPPAIALLKEEHQIFRALFDLAETIGEDVLFPLAGEICIRLAVHMSIEEEFLYPLIMPVSDPEKIGDAMLDHQLAKRMISTIMDAGREAPLRAMVRSLGEEVVRHANMEDRELLFDLRRAWEDGKVDLAKIGIQMQRRRRGLFTLIGSAAAETRALEADLLAEAVERPAQSGSPAGEVSRKSANRVSQGRP